MSKIHTLQKGALGDPYYLSLICENLGIGNMSTVICELADMFLRKKVNLKNTGNKLEISVSIANVCGEFVLELSSCLEKVQTMEFKNVISFISFKKKIKKIFSKFSEDESLFKQIKPVNGKIRKLCKNLDKLLLSIQKIKLLDENFKMKEQQKELKRDKMESDMALQCSRICNQIKRIGDTVIDAIFYFYPQRNKKKKCFKGLVNMTVFMQCFDQRKYLIKERGYNQSIESIGIALGIGAEKMNLIIDIFAGDPRRIFGLVSEEPVVDPWRLKSKEKMAKVRVNLVAEALKMKAPNVEKLASYWIHSYNMINMGVGKEIHFPENEERIEDNGVQLLNKDVFEIDPSFFRILQKSQNAESSEKLSEDLREDIVEFLSQRPLKELGEMKLKYERESGINKGAESYLDNSNIGEMSTQGSKYYFLNHFQKEMKGLEGNAPELMENHLQLEELDRQNLLEIFNIIAELQSNKGEVEYKTLFDTDKEFSIFKNLPEIFDEDHYECIQVLLLINSCSWSSLNFTKTYELKYIFLPAVILFNGNILVKSLSTLPRGNRLNKYLTNKLKGSVEKPNQLNDLYNSMENLYPILFEAGYFDRLCRNMMTMDMKSKEIRDYGKGLIGVWRELSSHGVSKEAVQKKLLSLTKRSVSPNYKILMSIVSNDTIQEPRLKKFFNICGIPTELGLNILKIKDHQNNFDYYKGTLNLLNGKCAFPNTIGAFMSCFKQDTTNLKDITQKLTLDPENAALIFPLALKSSNISFKKLANIVNAKDEYSLELLMKIACGEIEIFKDLTFRNRRVLSNDQYDLLSSILTLQKIIDDHMRYHNLFNLKQVLRCCTSIAKAILANLNLPKKAIFDLEGEGEGDLENEGGSLLAESEEMISDYDYEQESEESEEIEENDENEGGSSDDNDVRNIDDIPQSNGNINGKWDNDKSDSEDEEEDSNENSLEDSGRDVNVKKSNKIKRKKNTKIKSIDDNSISILNKSKTIDVANYYGDSDNEKNNTSKNLINSGNEEEDEEEEKLPNELSSEEKLTKHIMTLVLFSLGSKKASEDIYKKFRKNSEKENGADKSYYKKSEIAELSSQYITEGHNEDKTKEIWKIDNDKRTKQKKTCKVPAEKNKYKTLLKRRNLFIKMAREDGFYKEMISTWAQLKDKEEEYVNSGVKNPSSTMDEFKGDAIQKEEGRVYCSSVVSTFKAMEYLYYECDIEGVKVDLCLACARGCQASQITTLKPKRGYMV